MSKTPGHFSANLKSFTSNSIAEEAGLNFLLESPTTSGLLLESVITSAERKQRYQVALLRRGYQAQNDSDPDAGTRLDSDLAAIEAAQVISILEAYSSPADWQMLMSIAEGNNYASVPSDLGTSPGAVRVRILG